MTRKSEVPVQTPAVSGIDVSSRMKSSKEPIYTYHGDELDVVPPEWPKRPPPGAVTLGKAAWSFSPASSRFDTYKGWIGRRAGLVYIWWRDPALAEDYGVAAKFRPYASGPLVGSEREALRNTLAFAWAQEVVAYDHFLEAPTETRPAFLTREDLALICTEVWDIEKSGLTKLVFSDGKVTEVPITYKEWRRAFGAGMSFTGSLAKAAYQGQGGPKEKSGVKRREAT